MTREQVRALDNPRLRRGIEVKISDSRSKSFIKQYGNRCWETDILPASTIEEALDFDIRQWLKADLWKQRETAIERARKLP